MSIQGGPYVISDANLLLSLDAGNPKSYAGSGTTWTDLSGNGKTGTLTSGPTFSGLNGGSIVFDGVDDYVVGSVPTTSNSVVSVTGFAKVTYGTAGCIFKVGDGCAGYSFGIGGSSFLDNGNNIIGLYSRVVWLATGVAWKRSGWNGFALVINGTTANFYNDGSLVASMSGYSPATVTGNYYLGRCVGDESSPSERAFEGNLANIQIYNRILSSGEVLANFNALKSRFGL